MEIRVSLIFLLLFHLLLFVHGAFAQLSPAESRILFQVRKQLEYPEVLGGWNNWTNFCYLPPSSSLVVVCSDNHITELTIVGNRSSPNRIPKPMSGNSVNISQYALSEGFSTDSFFTVLTKLSNLKVLRLVSLGLWGPLPAKVDRLWSLEVFNISSNFLSGKIPSTIATFNNLRSLSLADNLFTESIPDLKGLQTLEELDLGNNHLGPEFPSLTNNLKNIILKRNFLRSNIPSGIIKFDQLQVLDVSSNKLVGPVPSSLFSLPSIQYLNLAKNQFTGALSPNLSCNGKLNFVDISNNLLTGKLPSCLKSNSKTRRVFDMWNCLSSGTSKYQHQYSFCQKAALAVDPIKKEKQQKTVKLGIVIGIIGGLIGVAGLFGLLILAMYRRSEAKRETKNRCEGFVFNKNPVRSPPILNGSHVPMTLRLSSLLPPYHVFTLEDLEDATNNFDPSNLVGEGSQERLYKGWLRDGTVALIKCLKLKQRQSPQFLHQHMEVISKLRHRYLVSVLGHCIVSYEEHPTTVSTIFIVLENVANGSLRDHLSDRRKKEVLKWPQRIAISMGVANGLQFLHTGVAPGIFGNDLKIENILLDETLNPKICSYNIALQSKAGSESNFNKHEKEDIYQLGIILLEVITGRPANSEGEVNNLKLQLEESLAATATSKLWDAIDPSLRGTYASDSLKTMAQITINCLCRDPSMRPSIEDVLWHMQYSKQVQEGWTTSSGNLGTKL